MNKIILILCSFLSVYPELTSQTCVQIWDNIKMPMDSEKQLELLNEYIGYGCKDSIAEALFLRGKIYYDSDQLNLASRDFLEAVQIDPNIPELWYHMALLVYLADNSASSGLGFINNAISQDPQNYHYFMLKGDIQVARRELNEGLNSYERSLELLKNNKGNDKNALALTYNAIGGTLIELSQTVHNEDEKTKLILTAIENLQEATKIDSLFDAAYFLLGNAYFYQKNYLESVYNFEKCVFINPNRPSLITNLAIVYRETGKYFGEQKSDLPKALEFLEKSYQLNQKDAETLRLLGVAHGINGENEVALNWFLKASEIAPDNAFIWWNLGTAYGILGKKKEMKKCRKTALSIDPDIEKKM